LNAVESFIFGEVAAARASEYFKIYSVWSKVKITGNEKCKK